MTQALAQKTSDDVAPIDTDAAYWYIDSIFGSQGTPNGMVALAGMDEDRTRRAIRGIISDLRENPDGDEGLAEHIITSLVIAAQDTERLTCRDRLTGLSNRARFEELLHFHLERVSRNLTDPGVIVYIDLNDFKPINDNYGHDVGDVALKLAAKTIKETVRFIDVPARIGGDEFVVLLPDSGLDEATQVVSRLRDAFSSLSFGYKDNTINVRASIGMAEIEAGYSAEQVFAAGDAAMYEIKKTKPSSRSAQIASPALAPR